MADFEIIRSGSYEAIIFLFVWLGVLIFFSTGKASVANTSRFIEPLLKSLFPKSSREKLHKKHTYIRKFAHFFGYGILALAAYFFFTGFNFAFLQSYWFPLSLGLVIFVAAVDEFHQSFNPARVGSLSDVLLDTCGGLTFLLFILLFRLFW